MNLIVFGATGKTGKHVLKAALDRGAEVTAFARSPQKLDGFEGVRIAEGDVLDPESVAAAIPGHDAVIVALGSVNLKDATTLSAGTRNVLAAMNRHGVRRLVALSAVGVAESWGQLPLLPKLLFRTMLRNVLADHEAQEALVRDSSLDWTIVRAAILKDGPATGEVTASNTGKVGNIQRADVAAFLVAAATEGTYRGQTISITS